MSALLTELRKAGLPMGTRYDAEDWWNRYERYRRLVEADL